MNDGQAQDNVETPYLRPTSGAPETTEADIAQGTTGDQPARPHPPTFDRHMLEALVCPVTRGPLSFDAERQELMSRAAHLAFPIRDGIPIMLVSEAREVE